MSDSPVMHRSSQVLEGNKKGICQSFSDFLKSTVLSTFGLAL